LEAFPAERVINGTETVKYVNNELIPLDEIYMTVPANVLYADPPRFYKDDLDALFLERDGKFEITKVLLEGKEISYDLNGEFLKIPLERPVLPSGRLEISVAFECVVPKARYRFGANEKAVWLSGFFPQVCVFDETGWRADGFYPVGEPYFSDVANFTVSLKTPPGYAAFGATIESFVETGTEVITTFEERLIRNFPLVIYDLDFLSVYTQEIGSDTDIFYYSFSGDSPERKEILSAAADAIEYYNFIVGTYPYKNFHIFEIEYYQDDGFAAAGSIFLNDPLEKWADESYYPKNPEKEKICRLIGKQWFGEIVAADPVKEPWVNDGLAGLMADYVLYNEARIDKKIQEEREELAKFIEDYEFPNLSADASVYKSREEFRNIHAVKSKIMFYALRRKLTYSNFINILKKYYETFAFKNVYGKDLIAECEKIYKENLDEFFNNWIEGYLPEIYSN
jgi:hypothetical protein